MGILLGTGKNGGSAITMDGNTTTFSVGLKNRLNIHSNFDGKTSNGINLSTIVSNVVINGGTNINSVTPSSIDLFDGSANIKKEGTMTVVRTLASIREMPFEINVGHTQNVLESPSERSIVHILETLKIQPINTLRNSTSPIVLGINNRLTSLHDFPNLLTNSNDLIDIDILDRTDVRKKLGSCGNTIK